MAALLAAVNRSRSRSDCNKSLEHCIRPEVDAESAIKLVQKLYNINVMGIKEFPGYDDRNYYIKVQKYIQPDSEVAFYTLKITNNIDSLDDLIEALNSLINYIHKADLIEVPYPIPNIHGETVSREHLNSGQLNAVRLMHFIPGKLLKDFEYTEKLAFSAGQLAAKLDILLRNFHNLTLENRKSIWFFDFIFEIDKFFYAITNADQKALVESILNEFKATLNASLHNLVHQIIHGDLNEQNIIVRDTLNGPEIVGLIDFGDVNKAPKIFELAILCCYMTLDSSIIDPIIIPKYILNGYKSVDKISQLEMKVLPICVMARLMQSLVLGAYSYMKDPKNDYVLCSSIKGWTILQKLNEIGSDKLRKMWSDE